MKTIIQKVQILILAGMLLVSSVLKANTRENKLRQTLIDKMETVVDGNAEYIQEI